MYNTMPIHEFMRIVRMVGNKTWIRYQLNYGAANLGDRPQIMSLHVVDLAKMNDLHIWTKELNKAGLCLKCIENVNGIDMATYLIERDDNIALGEIREK